MNSVLDSPNPHRLMSLASRIKAIHRALTAEELAELLQMSRITILRRAKRGSIPSFRVGSCVRFDSAAIAKWHATGRAIHVQTLVTGTEVVKSSDCVNTGIESRWDRSANMSHLLRKLWRHDEGQDIAEYAVMLAVILVIVVGTIRLIGSNANNVFSAAASSIQ